MMKTKLLTVRIAVWCLVLSLVLFSAGGTAVSEGEAPSSVLTRYTDCSTVSLLIEAADSALKDGAEPKQVYNEMMDLAQKNGILLYLNYAIENIAAESTDGYVRMHEYFDSFGDSLQTLSPDFESLASGRRARNDIGFDAYQTCDVSDAFRAMVADGNAQYCEDMIIWPEESFSTVFGTDFAQFTPCRPRAGYVCVVVAKGSEDEPRKIWAPGDAHMLGSTVDSWVYDLAAGIMRSAPESVPVFTGNPNLASSFWVIDLRFPYFSAYGDSTITVEGFDTTVYMKVTDAKTHLSIAQISAKNRLPNPIESWHGNVAEADTPVLKEQKGFSSFTDTVLKDIRKKDSSTVPTVPVTVWNAEEILNGFLSKQAQNNNNVWQVAVCHGGVRDVAVNGDVVTFHIRSFDPRPGELGIYSQAPDRIAWLDRALENASRYDTEIAISLEDRQITDAGTHTLASAVRKAAEAAQQGFSSPDMQNALRDRLFPQPVSGSARNASELLTPSEFFMASYDHREDGFPRLTREQLAVACYAQKNQTISVTGGPHAITFYCVGGDFQALVKNSAKALLDELAFTPSDHRISSDSLAAALAGKLAEASFEAHTKATLKYSFDLDIDDLAAGRYPAAYVEYMEGIRTDDVLESLAEKLEKLPDAAATEMPKNGCLQGENSGAEVRLSIPSDADPTYAQIRDSSGRIAASAFILPGKQVFTHVPDGTYTIVFCSGSYWYGEDGLFGELGTYIRSGEITIDGSRRSHSFTLDRSDGSGLTVSEGSPDDFR